MGVKTMVGECPNGRRTHWHHWTNDEDVYQCDLVSVQPLKGSIGLAFGLNHKPKQTVVNTRVCSYCKTVNIQQGHNCPNCGANR